MRDRLRVVGRKQTRLGGRAHNIWATTPRKIRVISLSWIKVKGERVILDL